MIRKNHKGIIYYEFHNLSKESSIKHLFSTRIGGVSSGKFSAMNLSFNRGDDEALVMENYRRISEIGFPREKMVFSDQIHETAIRHVTAGDQGKGISSAGEITGIDGLMTNVKGVVLVTFHADCPPLYFYDKAKNAIALSHAGWRGTLGGIGKITVDEMREKFGSNPCDILAAVGPSICYDCFETDTDVAEMFTQKYDFSPKYIKSPRPRTGKSFIDLWGMNKQMLMDSGIPEENIELPELCTKCNPDIFYSHRAMGWDRGNMAAFLTLSGSDG